MVAVGLSGVRIENGLKEVGVDIFSVGGIFVTHEHSDHSAGVGVLSRRYDIPIYATKKTWAYFSRTNSIGKIKEHNMITIKPNVRFMFKDMIVNPFEIPHDAAEPVGYNIFAENKKISVATDIGHVNDCLKKNLVDSDLILIESNHDLEMLKNGPYPNPLKRRVMGDYGHLSNHTCGELLVEVMSGKLKNVFLGQLSQDNNIPLLAYETVKGILQ